MTEEELGHAHAHHDEGHGALRVLWEEEDQQAQDRPGADELLGELHGGGRADVARAVKVVLVEILNAGEEDAGQKQQEAQLGRASPRK